MTVLRGSDPMAGGPGRHTVLVAEVAEVAPGQAVLQNAFLQTGPMGQGDDALAVARRDQLLLVAA